MSSKKRNIDILVLSDVHLGTHGCHSKELLVYLKSVKPKMLILNGDIIDIWQFSKRYWPKSHMKVVKHIIGLASKGVTTYYITGNHDEILRKFAGFKIGSLHILNNLVLDLDGRKTWFFHGDVFDVIMQYSKWLAKLGSFGYDALIMLNNIINRIYSLFGKDKVSLSKKIKENVKSAVKYINNFEVTAAMLAVKKGYRNIVCGHIHHAEIRDIKINDKVITYLNSGDWVENLTALEYHKKEWKIYTFPKNPKGIFLDDDQEDDTTALADYDSKELFQLMLEEFKN